jgi:hypothetical protein
MNELSGAAEPLASWRDGAAKSAEGWTVVSVRDDWATVF